MHKGICPNCVKITDLELIQKPDNIEVRGELIPVDDQYLLCHECGTDFDDPRSDFDVLDVAYREYRRRHNMLQPEDIKSFRDKSGLSEKQLSSLLGFHEDALRRYEVGALQTVEHERALQLYMESNI
jgi:putative zinc finger/helix-turn-helix YgiT family protein